LRLRNRAVVARLNGARQIDRGRPGKRAQRH
jgi:hypothetical protein